MVSKLYTQINQTEGDMNLTAHASARMQQRAFPRHVVEAIVQYGAGQIVRGAESIMLTGERYAWLPKLIIVSQSNLNDIAAHTWLLGIAVKSLPSPAANAALSTNQHLSSYKLENTILAQDLSIARAYFDKIDGQSANNILTDPKLTIERDGNIQICYSPFDHVEKSARVVIVGITPGMTQAVNALNAMNDAKLAGKSIEEALRTAK